MKNPKRPRDPNQLAKLVKDLAVGEDENIQFQLEAEKNPHAVALGRLGGLKGGKARAEKLTKEQRVKIAQKAAKVRWNKKKKESK